MSVLSGSEAVAWQNRTQASPSVTAYEAFDNTFDDNGKLLINNQTQGSTNILTMVATADDGTADNLIVFYETAENSGVFVNTDDSDNSNIEVKTDAKRGFTATFDYNDSAQSFVVANDFGVINMDETSVGDVWNSGEALTVTLIDQDLNKNTFSDEDLSIQNTTNTHIIPTLTIGNPVSLDKYGTNIVANSTSFSKIGYYTNSTYTKTTGNAPEPFVIKDVFDGTDVNAIDTINTYFNYDVRSLGNSTNPITTIKLFESDGTLAVSETTTGLGIVEIAAPEDITDGHMYVEVFLTSDVGSTTYLADSNPIILDVFSYGNTTNNALYRILLEETDENTAEFVGSVEFTMINQINVDKDATYTNLSTIDPDVDIIVHEDLTDEDSPRVNYNDLGADGVSTQIADQVEAPTHNGVVSFDLDNYKIGDTVVVTLDDQDMNEDSELIDVYITNQFDRVGDTKAVGLHTGLVLDITFDDVAWINTQLMMQLVPLLQQDLMVSRLQALH